LRLLKPCTVLVVKTERDSSTVLKNPQRPNIKPIPCFFSFSLFYLFFGSATA
jgi:hypothetical protein